VTARRRSPGKPAGASGRSARRSVRPADQAARTARAPATAGALIDPREIERLSALMEQSGLVELEIERGGERVRLLRGRPSAAASVGASGAGPQREPASPEVGARAITSPMVGTFHRAAAPEAPAFVEAGDVVERGQVLCLIEAMKMMNEIEAEFRGRVVSVMVENGCPVEFGEPLFLIDPV
jgi:biotin carboxyl carrier protein